MLPGLSSRGGTAPKLTDHLDLATLETITDTPERACYRCRLKAGEAGDKTAEFLRATLVLHKPTKTIESLELASAAEFSPTWRIRASKNCKSLQLKPGVSKVCTTPAHFPLT